MNSVDLTPIRWRNTGSEIDTITRCDDGVVSGRMAIYCNGEREEFAYRCGIVFTLERPTLERPLYVGISPIAQHPLGNGERGGYCDLRLESVKSTHGWTGFSLCSRYLISSIRRDKDAEKLAGT